MRHRAGILQKHRKQELPVWTRLSEQSQRSQLPMEKLRQLLHPWLFPNPWAVFKLAAPAPVSAAQEFSMQIQGQASGGTGSCTQRDAPGYAALPAAASPEGHRAALQFLFTYFHPDDQALIKLRKNQSFSQNSPLLHSPRRMKLSLLYSVNSSSRPIFPQTVPSTNTVFPETCTSC